MNTKASNAETSIEFAIDNALERIHLLTDKDRTSLLIEYKEWLNNSKSDLEILIIDYLGNNR
tara:strand:+ start:915 stop:1100 length:186 start_codon:yes stop_codon:yes gene_type:complete